MKTIGQVVLVAWLLLSLFAFVGSVLKSSVVGRIFRQHHRNLNIAGVILMMTWIMLLALSGLFKS